MRALAAAGVLTVLLGGVAMAVETHPFSVHDMLAMDRISDPRVSPDGTPGRVHGAGHRPRGQQGPHRPLARGGRRLRAAPADGARRERHAAALVARRHGGLLPVQPVGQLAGVAHRRRRRRGGAGDAACRSTSTPSRWLRAAARCCSRWRCSRARRSAETKAALEAQGQVRRRRAWCTTGCSSATGTPGRTARATTCSPTPCAAGPATRPDAGDGRRLPDPAVRRQRGLRGRHPTARPSSSRPGTPAARRRGRPTTTSSRCRLDGSRGAAASSPTNPAWDAQPRFSPDGKHASPTWR